MPRALRRPFAAPFLFASLAGLVPGAAHADEGMWPFEMAPREKIQKDRGVAIDDAWLDHLRLASVRFVSGGSGSFVSPTGLVLTNHHVAADCIGKLGKSTADYMNEGFRAGVDGPELKCPEEALDLTVAMKDVTDRVKSARKEGMTDAQANDATKAAMADIEKECAAASGNMCDVVTLYAGGKYELYTYHRYTDVRLVFAPEHEIAFFGGDPENFTYPRYDYDIAIFRAYENGAPVKPAQFLKWNAQGPNEGDPVFVSGYPGATKRLETVAEMKVDRDVDLPARLAVLKTEIEKLRAFAKTGKEPKREVETVIYHLSNSQKARTGYLDALKNPGRMQKKTAAEEKLGKALAKKPEYQGLLDQIRARQEKRASLHSRWIGLEWGDYARRSQDSELLKIARDLVRLPAELAKPSDTRLREYRDSNLEEVKRTVLSPAPIYGGVEVPLVETWLARLARDLGTGDAAVKALLAGRTPAVAAREMVAQSKLFDVYARRALWGGGAAAVAASTDPIVAAVRAIDGDARAVRKTYADEVEGPMRLLGAKVAQALFAVNGTTQPPDATFSLRLSYGVVKGYDHVAWDTTIAGLFKHATGTDPLKLPKRWIDAQSKLDPKMPLNYALTADIIGGNSGSPLVDRNGDLVGVVFDINLPALGFQYAYGEETERSMAVDSAAMLDAMSKVYAEDALVKELLGQP
jgi:S1-C subfamily serine protease